MMARRSVRMVLFFGSLALVVVRLAAPGRSDAFDPDTAVTLSLVAGPQFGEASVYLGDQVEGPPLAGDEAVRRAVQTAVHEQGKTDVVIRAAGDVVHREVIRVCELAGRALPAGNHHRVHLAVLEPS